MAGFRNPRPGELAMPVSLGTIRLLQRAIEHEVNICQSTQFAIHSTRHERMTAESEATKLRELLTEIKRAV